MASTPAPRLSGHSGGTDVSASVAKLAATLPTAEEEQMLGAAYLEEGSMLGARRRHASSMDTMPSASTAALYTVASWRPSDMDVYCCRSSNVRYCSTIWQSCCVATTTLLHQLHV